MAMPFRLRQRKNLLLYLVQIAGGDMANKLTDKQKTTLWQQRRSASYQASCRLEGLTFNEAGVKGEAAEARLASLRRQYGG
jgi:hypothetical protein